MKMNGYGLVLLLLTLPLCAQKQPPVSRLVAETVMHIFPHGNGKVWNYEEGTVLEGMDGVWAATDNRIYLQYIQQCVDRFVGEDGSIRTYDPQRFSLDMVLMGRQLIFLYDVTGKEKYHTAASQLYNQLKHQPRTPEGGFWHKKIYPDQMWLDGIYMAEPFYAEYAARFHHPQDFNDIATQFQLLADHARDPKTGLLYHAWDESKKQRWANPANGDSPSFWSRGMGWYAMGLVDVLDYLPPDHPARAKLVAQLNQLATALVATQGVDGLWWQITDKPEMPGNYTESSASAMFVYALEKGVRKKYLPESYRAAAQKGYAGILQKFVRYDDHGLLHLTGTTSAVGLGGEPVYRDGSYAYYTGVSQVSDDERGLGALLLASNEMEKIPSQSDRNTAAK